MAKKSYSVEDLRSEGAGIAPDYVERDGKLICSKCGAERLVGANPFCPHEGAFGNGLYDPFTPYLDPNLDPHGKDRAVVPGLGFEMSGTWVTSREHRRQLMKEHNLEWAGRSCESGGREV